MWIIVKAFLLCSEQYSLLRSAKRGYGISKSLKVNEFLASKINRTTCVKVTSQVTMMQEVKKGGAPNCYRFGSHLLIPTGNYNHATEGPFSMGFCKN